MSLFRNPAELLALALSAFATLYPKLIQNPKDLVVHVCNVCEDSDLGSHARVSAPFPSSPCECWELNFGPLQVPLRQLSSPKYLFLMSVFYKIRTR